MNFDCIIIGGGISGLTCGLKCVNEGLSCAIISSGMSALHFSSGSIDLLGYYPANNVVRDPFDRLEEFIKEKPDHPYAKCGIDSIENGLTFLKNEAMKNNLEFFSKERGNHFHVTTLGTVKPTFLSQTSVFNEQIDILFSQKQKIAILNIDGFRDFHPGLTASNLRRQTLFKNFDIITGLIKLPELKKKLKQPNDFRSIDISRIFDRSQFIDEIASQIKKLAGDAKIVALPAFLGIEKYDETIKRLSELTDRFIYEIPTLPPSILGMRLDNALKSRFAELGGVFIAGDRVVGGDVSNGKLDRVYTQNHEARGLSARFFALTAGSFFSGGMVAESNLMKEPIFDLSMDYDPGRENWRSQTFFQREGHPFLSYGVKTNEIFNPCDQSGKYIENLFCSGAILSGYNPIMEGTGCGVAIGTGYFAAERIIGAGGNGL